MNENLGDLILRRTKTLTNALQTLRLSDRTRWEIAFHIAELSPEFEAILEIVKKADGGQKMTRQDLSTLEGMVRYHWPMHLRPLVRYLGRAFDELGEEEVDDSETEGMTIQVDAPIAKRKSPAKRSGKTPSKKISRIKQRSPRKD